MLGKVSVVPKGSWISNESYEKLDIVTYEGSSYMAKENVSVGIPVSNETYWLKMVDKGPKGDVGPVGPVGPQPDLVNSFDDSSLDKAPTARLTNNINSRIGVIDNAMGIISEKLNEASKYVTNMVVDVKVEGAVGNGINDDTEAILKAIEEVNKFYTAPNLIANYVCAVELYFPPGVYKVEGDLVFKPLPGQSNRASDHRTVLTIRGSSMYSSKLILNSGSIKAKGIGLNFTDMLIDGKHDEAAIILGEKYLRDTDGKSTAINMSVFSRLKVTGSPKALEVRYMYDTSFYDCQFGSFRNITNVDPESAVVDFVVHDEDMCNFIRFYSCRFEWSESNSVLLRVRGGSGVRYHHNFTLYSCHFETHNYSTIPFDVEKVRNFSMQQCSFAINEFQDSQDTLTEKPSEIKDVQGLTMTGCRFFGTRGIENSPYLKLSGDIMNLDINNTSMHGVSNFDLNRYIDVSEVTDIKKSESTWKISINKGSTTSPRYEHPIRNISLKESNRRFVESAELINGTNIIAHQYTQSTIGEAFNEDNPFFGYTQNGIIRQNSISSNLRKSIAKDGMNNFTIQSSNVNKRGMFIVFADNPTATFALIFSTGTSLAVVSKTDNLEVSNSSPTDTTNGKAYIYLNNRNIEILSKLDNERTFMIVPFVI